MKTSCVLAFLLLALSGCLAKITFDFDCTLETNSLSKFQREVWVNGHGITFRNKTPLPMMEYLVEELGVPFTRAEVDAPFSHSQGTWETRTTTEQLRKEGSNNMKRKIRNDDFQNKHFTRHRITFEQPAVYGDLFNSDGVIPARAKSYAARFYKYFYDDDVGITKPFFYECVNEPFVKWKTFRMGQESEKQVNTRLTRGCIDLCKAIRGEHPDINVGGYAAAFTRPFYSNFDNFNRRMRIFLDNIGPDNCVNFVSEHLYDTDVALTRANFDLLESYQYTNFNGRIRDYVVSELGSTKKNWYDPNTNQAAPPLGGRYWVIISQLFKITMTLMQVPDRVKKVIPFLTMHPGEGRFNAVRPYPWQLALFDDRGRFEFSTHVNYYKMLKNVEGDFIYTHSDDINIVVNGASTKQRAHLMLVNASVDKTRSTTLDAPYAQARIRRVVIRRLWLDETSLTNADRQQELKRAGTVMFSETIQSSIPDRLSLKPEEMVVIEVSFIDNVKEKRKVSRTRYYHHAVQENNGNAIAFPHQIVKDRRMNFKFRGLPRSNRGMAYLRVSHSRTFTVTDRPQVFVNGEEITAFSAEQAGPKHDATSMHFGQFIVPVETRLLGQTPTVTVRYPDQGGWVSSIVIEVDLCDDESCCLLGGRERNLACPTPSNAGPVRQNVPPREVLKNQSFEVALKNDATFYNSNTQLLDEWYFEGQAEIKTGTGYWGDNFVQFGNSDIASANQHVYLVPNVQFRFTCYVRGDVTMDVLQCKNRIIRGKGKEERRTLVSGSEWELLELKFRVAAAGFYTLRIGAPEKGKSGSADVCQLKYDDRYEGPPASLDDSPPEPLNRANLGQQLFVNPSFENRAGWTLAGSGSYRDSLYYDGSRSLILPPGASATQEVSLKKDKRYRLSCFVQFKVSVRIKYKNEWLAADETDAIERNEETVGTSWGLKEVLFKTCDASKYTFIIFSGDSTQGFADLCELRELNAGPVNEPGDDSIYAVGPQLLQDGGFENSTSGWRLSGGAEVTRSQVLSGSRSLNLKSGNSRAQQTVTLRAGVSYELSCRTRGEAPLRLHVLHSGSLVAANDDGKLELIDGTFWNRKVLAFTAARGGNHVIAFQTRSSGARADQCFLKERSLYEEIPSFKLGPQLMVNPNFEDGTRSWELGSNSQVVQSARYRGNRGLKLNSGGGGASQLINLSKDLTYLFSCYVSTTSPVRVQVFRGETLQIENANGLVIPDESQNGWARREVTFVAPATRSYRFAINTVGSDTGTADNCSVRRVIEDATPNPNPTRTPSPTPAPSPTPSAPPTLGSQLLNNPSFESDFAWVLTGNAAYTTSESYIGSRGINLPVGPAVVDQEIRLESNSEYRFSCFVMGEGPVSLMVLQAGSLEAFNSAFMEDTARFLEKDVYFTTTAAADYVIRVRTRDSHTGFADVCRLWKVSRGSTPTPRPTPSPTPTPSGDPVFGEQLLTDPNFEFNGRWQLIGTAKYVTDMKYAGARGVDLPEGNAAIRQEMRLERNSEYFLSCFVAGPGPVRLQILRSGSLLFSNTDTTANPNRFLEKGMFFNIDTAGDYVVSINTGTGASGYADICRLKKVVSRGR